MNNEKIKQIAEHYGYDAQSRQLIEEMAELTQAINKKWRFEQKTNKKLSDEISLEYMNNQLIEEIADVTIMIEQMKYLLNIADSDIELFIEQKLDRQLGRIVDND